MWRQRVRQRRLTVVNDDELVAIVGALRVRIDLVRYTVSGPASVGNADVGVVNRVQLQKAFHCNQTTRAKLSIRDTVTFHTYWQQPHLPKPSLCRAS